MSIYLSLKLNYEFLPTLLSALVGVTFFFFQLYYIFLLSNYNVLYLSVSLCIIMFLEDKSPVIELHLFASSSTLPMNPIISSLFTLSLLSSFASSLSSTHAQQCHFPAIFNFGDSNSDTGGLSAAFGQAGPPHGSSFFGSPAGRYCDGRLVIDFIGKPTLFYISKAFALS